MSKQLVFIVFVVGSLLIACGSKTKYVHPNKTPEEYQKDLAQCDFEATKVVETRPNTFGETVGGLFGKSRYQRLVDKCMRAKGYQVVD